MLLVLATLLGGIAREAGWAWGEQIASIWPWVVLVVLSLFLALQILPFLIGGNASPPSAGPPGDKPRRE
jgi:hypothetical protein